MAYSTEKGIKMKRTCKKCKVEKELEDFGKASNCKNGRRYTCHKCRNLRYVKKGPCEENPSWFKKGHEFIKGGEKGWFSETNRPKNIPLRKGEQIYNFKDGKSKDRAKLNRKHFQGKRALKLRLQTLERDGYKCMKCINHFEKLHIHHIIPLRVDPSKSYDLDNLITLCPKCHANVERELMINEGLI